MSLLSILPDGTTRRMSTHLHQKAQAVAVLLAQNLQTPRTDVPHATVPDVEVFRPQESVFVVVVHP